MKEGRPRSGDDDTDDSDDAAVVDDTQKDDHRLFKVGIAFAENDSPAFRLQSREFAEKCWAVSAGSSVGSSAGWPTSATSNTFAAFSLLPSHSLPVETSAIPSSPEATFATSVTSASTASVASGASVASAASAASSTAHLSGLEIQMMDISGVDHFDIMEKLADPDFVLTGLLIQWLRSIHG